MSAATALAITNPLVKYRALVATKQVLQDPAQLRLALHLQKLYDRLKDYEPQLEYSARLNQISRFAKAQETLDEDNHEVPQRRLSTWRALMAAKEQRDSLALTRRLTSHESAMELTSPKGLMVHGEVGTGKSMLIDLFADCLPTRKKRRYHFNTFMLEMFAKLETYRRSRVIHSSKLPQPGDGEADDYSLLWLAKELVQTSPILFLDEFQMPDRVASKILTHLMTSFFHLGGVLVATSNRMPEELAKAAGEDFPLPAPSRLESLGWQFGLRRRTSGSDWAMQRQNEFARFLEVLKARCEVWEMGGGRDYRRIDAGGVAPAEVEMDVDECLLDGHDEMQHKAGMAGWPAADVAEKDGKVGEAAHAAASQLPRYYSASGGEDAQESLAQAITKATGTAHLDGVPWTAAAVKVYGRTIPVPRAYDGVTMWTFSELCMTMLGPADYITLASTYHTVILTDVPLLTWLMKNEARRFITLLDALYECRCKLYVSAAAGPDDLFFPDMGKDGDENSDAVYSETISEVYQDATAPFRPNISSANPDYREAEAEPDYTHARLAGLLNADALEDDPPNKPHRSPFGRSFGRTDGEMERKPIDPDELTHTARPLDFGKTSRFTGEDERFAYKRAQSRLWEMCGARWWAREEEGWHRPLPVEVRRWERAIEDAGRTLTAPLLSSEVAPGDVRFGDVVSDESRDERSLGRQQEDEEESSPFRNSEQAPPRKISWTHIWGTAEWGPRAGAWGKGVEGLKEREKEK